MPAKEKVCLRRKLLVLLESEKILKVPKNLNGKVVLPLFNPTGMPLELLQDTLKALFQDAWGEIIIGQLIVHKS